MRNAFTGLSVHQQQHWTQEGKKRQEGFEGDLRKTLSISNFAASCKLVENQQFSRDFKKTPTSGGRGIFANDRTIEVSQGRGDIQLGSVLKVLCDEKQAPQSAVPPGVSS